MHCSQDTYLQVTHKQEDNHNCRGSPQGVGSKPHIRLPGLGVPHKEDKSSRTSGFESQWDLPVGELEGCRKQRLCS